MDVIMFPYSDAHILLVYFFEVYDRIITNNLFDAAKSLYVAV